MVGLAIQPHSRRDNRLAVLALSLVALGSFALGVGRQVGPAGRSPFPQAAPIAPQPAAIPDATPAPVLQVAEAEPRPARRAVAPEPADVAPDASATPPGAPAAASAPATDAAGADTAALAPDPPSASTPAPPPPPAPGAEATAPPT